MRESERAELVRLRRGNAQLRMENEILKKGGGLLRDGVDEVTRFAFVDREKALRGACRRPLGDQAKAKLPTIGTDIDTAMDLFEKENPVIRGVLPRNSTAPHSG